PPLRRRRERPGRAWDREAGNHRRARQRARHSPVQVDGARRSGREPPELRLILHEPDHSRRRARCGRVTRRRSDDAALAAARWPGEALGGVADRARRLHAGPRRGPGRALDDARARGRRARRREGASRRRLCPPGAHRRRGALRRPAHPRARLLGRGRAMSAMRILVVEDDERLAEIFRDFIAELGYQPTVVGSAEAALDALTSARPDTILLDVRLPGMSGVEFLSLPAVRDSAVAIGGGSVVATEIDGRTCVHTPWSDAYCTL